MCIVLTLQSLNLMYSKTSFYCIITFCLFYLLYLVYSKKSFFTVSQNATDRMILVMPAHYSDFIRSLSLKRLWRKSVTYMYKTIFNTLCKFLISIVLVYSGGKVLYMNFLYTICYLFKMCWSQQWCMKSKSSLLHFARQLPTRYSYIFLQEIEEQVN